MAFSYVIHVQFFYYTALVIGMVYAYFVIFSWRDNRSLRVLGKPSSHLLVMVVICIGLAAFNLLPFITYLDYLSRETLTLAEANRDALPPGLVIFTIIPISLKFPEWEIYSGLLIFMLAPLAALSPRRRETRFWLVVALIFALLSLGTTTPLFSLAFHLIPGMRWLRVPSRMWLYTSIALVMLMRLRLRRSCSQNRAR
jgi:hypothetical protein